MNLVTAVLVEAALDEAESDKQESTLEMKRHLQEQLPVFNSLFNRLDTDNSGTILFEELLQCDSSCFANTLEYLNLGSLAELFDVFDVDESGELSHDEFVEGMVSLYAASHSGIPQEMYMAMTNLSVMKRSFHRVNDSLAIMHEANQRINEDLHGIKGDFRELQGTVLTMQSHVL